MAERSGCPCGGSGGGGGSSWALGSRDFPSPPLRSPHSRACGSSPAHPCTRRTPARSYLDRLLAVNDEAYTYEAVFYIYASWNDSTAADTVRASTEATKNGSRE